MSNYHNLIMRFTAILCQVTIIKVLGLFILLLFIIVFVTKYRKKVITSEILQQLNKIFDQTCSKWECELLEFNGEVDHVHLLITFNPKVQLSKFIANLKTVSSRLIRRDFADYCRQFPSR